MDSKRDSRRLEELNFVQFYESLRTKDHERLGVTEDELYRFSYEFIKLSKGELTGLKKQIEDIKMELNVLNSAYLVLLNGYNEDMAKLVEEHGVFIDKDNVKVGCAEVARLIEKINKKVEMLSTNLPKEPTPDSNINAYDVLANLFTGLEFGTSFETVSVGEYLGYSRALSRKNDSIKKIRDGRRAGKN